MSRQKALTEEERRRRRNEASRRCYLKRKAALAGREQPAGAKNRKRPAPPDMKQAKARPAPKGKTPLAAAEKIVKRFAKIAAGIKPMVKEAAELLADAYKTEDRRTIEKIERTLSKGLGVSIASPAGDDQAKSRVLVQVLSKAVKTPKFRLDTQEDHAQFVPFPAPDEQPSLSEDEPEAKDEPAEVPVDPALLEKVETGEIGKSEIESKPESEDDDDPDEDDLDPDEYDPDLDDDEDDDDEDDDSEEAQERRARRREREESDNVREYESGRWEMMGEMGAQGAFDD